MTTSWSSEALSCTNWAESRTRSKRESRIPVVLESLGRAGLPKSWWVLGGKCATTLGFRADRHSLLQVRNDPYALRRDFVRASASDLAIVLDSPGEP
jgi:hypothetical protein